MNILQTARETFGWAKSKIPNNAELEIYASQGRGRSVLWSEQKCEQVSQAEGGGAGIRVILKEKNGAGRQGFAFSTRLTKDSIEQTAQKALESAQKLEQDEFRRIPAGPLSPSMTADGSFFDKSVFSETVTSLQERLKSKEALLLKQYPLLKSVLRAGYSEGMGETAIINSCGIETAYDGTHCSLGVSCLVEKDGERQEGGYGLSRIFRNELDWDSIFDQSARRSIALLGGQPIPSGETPVVFDPSVACEFLSLVSGAVCADSVQKGKSFLAGKIGQSVSSGLVSIVDDGTLKKGLGTSPVDDEGVPTQRTPVIEAGQLKNYLYDTYTALKDRTRSTGNASRAGFKSSPGPGTSNFYLCAGKTPREQILKDTRGLYLYEVMGLHMADPISGDFSVGVIGAKLENGEFKSGVRSVTLAGNILDMLKKIDAVGTDLTFFGATGSPTFRVSGLTVSGK